MRLLFGTASASAALLLACSSTSGGNGSPPGTAPSADAGVADATSCPTGTHAADDGCDATLAWQKAGTLSPARNHHVTFAAKSAAGTFLYAIGGLGDMTANPIPFYADAQMAAIGDDGTLGPFRPTSPLPDERAGHGVALVGDVVVLTGGLVRPEGGKYGPSGTTLVSRIGADGALAAWASGPTISSARYHHAMATHEQWIYVIGGLGATGAALADVWRATVGADGSVSAWDRMTSLPATRAYHGSIVHQGALYVVGGGDEGSNFRNDVIRAPLGDDGSLGEWTKVSDLPVDNGAFSLIELAGRLYMIGGVHGPDHAPVASVRRARFMDDGSLGPWEDASPLATPRAHVHQTPLVGAHVYSAGGALDDGSPLGDVVIGTFE